MISVVAAAFIVIFLLPIQASSYDADDYEVEAVPCEVTVGESCTFSFHFELPPDVNVSKIQNMNWYKHAPSNGQWIFHYNNNNYGSGVSYNPEIKDGLFTLNTTDGSLTISRVATCDEIRYCFSGCFLYSNQQSYYNQQNRCVQPVIIIPIEEVRLCFRGSSGTSQCVYGHDDDDDVNVTVVTGRDVIFNCETLYCIRPGAIFKWFLGDRELANFPSTDKDCKQDGLTASNSDFTLAPKVSDHRMKLSCNASNQKYMDGGMAVGFYLNVHVPVDANKLTILSQEKVYQSGSVMPLREYDRAQVKCTAKGTRPAASISWILADRPHSSDRVEDNILNDGLHETFGYLEFEVKSHMHYTKLVCMAQTPDTEEAAAVMVSLVVEKEESNTGVIVGAILGTLGFVVLLLVAIIVMKKTKERRRRQDKEDVQVSTIRLQDRSPVPSPPTLCQASSDSCEGPPVSNRPGGYPDTGDGNSRYTTLPASQPFPRSKLTLLNLIGHGNFGAVYLAFASDILQLGSQTYVALKTLKETAGKGLKENLLREVDMMKRLPPHANVVRYLGSCLEKEPLYVIVEYLSNGNLQQYLRRNRSKDYTYIDAHNESLSCTDLIKFARDVAKGMAFLSSNKCIHRDLAARNVLVAGDKVCKISDFGLACDAGKVQTAQKRTNTALPLRWMALESLDKDLFSVKSDVWSFGIVLWEIVTFGARPFPNMAVSDVLSKLRQGYRMPKPRHCDEKLYDMMLACWDVKPDQRPGFPELLSSLENFLETEADYIVVGLYEEALYLTPNGSDTVHLEDI